MSDRWTGRLIDGRYVVESILGQGGMGVVLKARHKFTSAQVALKMLQPDLQMNADAKDRFLAEAQTPTTIGHPGIVQVTDAGVTPEGELYLAMELLTGRTLRQAMYPPMPPQVARRILLELLDALGAAHARGIVHRDLKPENVFLVGPQSTVKLLDFGIAKVVQAGRTAAGMMLGTLSYMAPEQLTDASSVDARADLWAVGVMVYEMLTGKLPFRGTQLAEIMTALASQEPDPIRAYLPQATPAMETFFARALCKDRNGRFDSAQDMGISVSAMLIEGTAPPVISTLTGLGSPRSHQMTAADSGQVSGAHAAQPAVAISAQLPVHHVPTPFGAPPTAPPGAPATPPPGAPATPPPGAPATPPPGARSGPPFAAPPGPSSPYGFVDHPATQQPYGFVDAPAKKPAGGMGGASWAIIGGVGALMVLLIFVVNHMTSGKQGFSYTPPASRCPSICSDIVRCSGHETDESLCQTACETMPKMRECWAQASGDCSAFDRCVEAAEAESAEP